MTVVEYILLGLVSGAFAAALGIGGGIIFVPVLVVFFAFPQHLAQGTSLAAILPTALVGTIVHARRRRIDWNTAGVLAVGGLIGGVGGARVALALDGPLLRRLFAGLLVVIAIRMLVQSRRSRSADPNTPVS